MQTRRLGLAGGVFGSLFAIASAAGQSVQVERYDSVGSLVQAPQTFGSGAAIDLGTVSADTARINIFSVGSGLADIGVVTFSAATRGSELAVFLGTGLIPPDRFTELGAVANNWGGLSVNANTQQWIRLSAGIAGDLNGPVLADTINRLQIGGVQRGRIEALGTLGDLLDIKFITAQSNDGDADIFTSGSIGTLEFTVPAPAKAISSNVIAGGSIDRIEASGSVGPAAGTPLVRIEARDGIGLIRGASVYASIEANVNNGTGGIGQVIATDGRFYGDLRASSAGDPQTPQQAWLATSGEPYVSEVVVTIEGNAWGVITMQNARPSNMSRLKINGSWDIPASGMADADVYGFADVHVNGDLSGTLRSGIGRLIQIDGVLRGNIFVDELVGLVPGMASGIVIGEFASGTIAGNELRGLSLFGDYEFLVVEHVQLCPLIHVRGNVASEGPVLIADALDTTLIVDGNVGPLADCYRWSGLLSEGGKAPLVVGGSLAGNIFIQSLDFIDADGIATPNSADFTDQVIVGANGAPATWSGELMFLDDLEGFVTLQRDQLTLDDYTFPHYGSSNTSGAIGVVPFHVHDETSFPENLIEYSLSSEVVLTSVFNGSCATGAGVQLEFYGPVATTGSVNQPKAEVVLLDANGNDLLDVSRFVSVKRDAVRPRQLNIRAKDGAMVPLPSGVYEVRPAIENRIVCADLLPGAPVTPVAAFTYRFRLAPDCTGGGQNGDQPDCIPDSANCGDTSICDSIDFNNNGVFPEEDDVTDFFNVLSGGSCSTGDCNDIDFNNNLVFPEEQDVILFFHVLAGGEC